MASVPGHIPTGNDWLDKIRAELRAADAYIVLLSERSIDRPWIWFETGAAWFSERRLVPVVLPGFEKVDIPQPLAAHQALSLNVQREVEQLAQDLGIAFPDPGSVVESIRRLCAARPRKADTAPSIQQLPDGSIVAPDFVLGPLPSAEISADAVRLLSAAVASDGSILCGKTQGGQIFEINGQALNKQGDKRESARWQSALKELTAAGFVSQTDVHGEVFDVTHEGYKKSDEIAGPGPSA